MLRSLKDLQSCSIQATDGEIGSVSHFLFDDVSWIVRYLVADTGNWMGDRKVLIAPEALGGVDWSPRSPLGFDWDARKLHVKLTREQIRHSPDIDTAKPVSRRQEEEYYSYYGWQPYWYGPDPFGGGMYPIYAGLPSLSPEELRQIDEQRRADEGESRTRKNQTNDDIHLRSTADILNYHIQASDGEIGHVDDFVLEDHPWAIRYLVIDTRNWWPGKKVLLSPHWISEISWQERKVHARQNREHIRGAPEYDPTREIGRGYEEQLHEYYQEPAYWEQLAARETKAD